MECKFCHAPMEENETLCPICGKAQTEETTEFTADPEEEDTRSVLTPASSGSWRAAVERDDDAEEADAEEADAEEADEEAAVAEETDAEETNAEETDAEEADAEETDSLTEEGETEEVPAPKKSLAWLWAIPAVLIVAALAALLIVLSGKAKTPTPDITLAEGRSYSLGNEFMTPGISKIVMASSQKRTIMTELKDLLGVDPLKEGLTNAELSILYWDTFIGFYQNYSYYISAMGLDVTAMDETEFDAGQTWQEFFLTQAINRYRMQKAVCDEARREGFTLTEELQKQLEDSLAGIRAEADVDQQLVDIYGPNVTLEIYEAYLREQYLYSAYVAELTERVEYTDAELNAYYDENAEYYEQNYVKKVDKNVVTIRHALIAPADSTVEADWATAKATAEDLYAQWQAGDKSEESFAELAMANSADGNATEGGIYEDVFPGQMVETFNDWCFADGRKPGDHGIVETDFGYHIIYFVKEGDYVYWKQVAEKDFVNEAVNDKAVALAESYTLYVDRDKIALALPGQFLTED